MKNFDIYKNDGPFSFFRKHSIEIKAVIAYSSNVIAIRIIISIALNISKYKALIEQDKDKSKNNIK